MNLRDKADAQLQSSIAALYRGPLEEFVQRRDALARELRAAGQREAAFAVKTVRKPSRMAWALDQVALNNRHAIADLETALSDTVNAHSQGGDVRSAIARLRNAARELADHAMQAAQQAGLSMEASALTTAVLAVLGTPQALDELRRGVLTDVPESGSIDFLASLPTPPQAKSPVMAPPRRATPARKVILQEFVSLDGFVADSNDSVDFIPAATLGDEGLGQRQMRFIDSVDAILLGRVTYQMFADYWPNVTTGEDKAFADKLNAIPKIVFSKTLKRAPWGKWGDATIVKTSAAKEVARLKQESGKSMVIWGSISLAQSLMKSELIDEYQLIVCPVVLTSGRQLFRGRAGAFDLKLRSSQSFDRGAVLLAYTAEQQNALVVS